MSNTFQWLLLVNKKNKFVRETEYFVCLKMRQARATWVWHRWGTRGTSATQVRHECYIKKRVRHESKTFLITIRVKTYFHISAFTFRQGRIARRVAVSFYELPFGNTSLLCQNAFEMCTTKNGLFNGKKYIKKLCTRL